MRELLAANPSLVNAYAPDGFHPLGLAAFFGNETTVEALLQAGADVNQQSREAMKVSALHSAAAARRPDIAQMLLAKGANPNLRGQSGITVFHEVAIIGQIDLAEMLLKHGADVNALDDSGKTPLAHADRQQEGRDGGMVAGAWRSLAFGVDSEASRGSRNVRVVRSRSERSVVLDRFGSFGR